MAEGKMADIPVSPYLASLVAIRVNNGGHQVLLMKRTHPPVDQWCQVAGKIEEGETAWQTALRELVEETGLVPDSLYSADICEQFYEPTRNTIAVAPVFVAFIDDAAEVTLNQEHSAFQWVSFSDAIEMVAFSGQRRVLRWIEAEFIERPPAEQLRIDV